MNLYELFTDVCNNIIMHIYELIKGSVNNMILKLFSVAFAP